MTLSSLTRRAALDGPAGQQPYAAAARLAGEGLPAQRLARRVGITTQGANQAVQRQGVVELAKVGGRFVGWRAQSQLTPGLYSRLN